MTEAVKLLDHWDPPAGAGRAIACIATSFTFDPDFFERDCLSRFLQLDTRPGTGSDVAHLIEQEERLAETAISLLVDRTYNPDSRTLRWDILPVAIPGGLMHAKVSLLLWERHLRCVIGSANLTAAGYRHQVETAVALNACAGSQVPAPVFEDVFDAIGRLIERAPGRVGVAGPKERCRSSLGRMRRFVESLALPSEFKRGAPRLMVATSEPGRDETVIDKLASGSIWAGGPPTAAWVLSPFFDDVDDGSPAVKALVDRVLAKRNAELCMVVPVESIGSGQLVRVPKSIGAGLPARLSVRFERFVAPDGDPGRRLHAKALLLTNSEWAALMVGSSNFTAAGLGLKSSGKHFEMNLITGARIASDEGEILWNLIPEGEQFEPEDDDVEWDPGGDEDELDGDVPMLPLGFVECLLDPGPPRRLTLSVDAARLPAVWQVAVPASKPFLDSTTWAAGGCASEVTVDLADDEVAFWVEIRWTDSAGSEWSAGLPVNVTDPANLPPPTELRDLPVKAILLALASTRPLHEALVAALVGEAHRAEAGESLDANLDPLVRYSSTGHLLQRTRQFSHAMEGLRRRLERPLASKEALKWRLNGPFGPVAIAESLAKEAERKAGLGGETAFLIAEIALTVRRVQWNSSPGGPSARARMSSVRGVLDKLALVAADQPRDRAIDSYVSEAFAEARR